MDSWTSSYSVFWNRLHEMMLKLRNRLFHSMQNSIFSRISNWTLGRIWVCKEKKTPHLACAATCMMLSQKRFFRVIMYYIFFSKLLILRQIAHILNATYVTKRKKNSSNIYYHNKIKHIILIKNWLQSCYHMWTTHRFNSKNSCVFSREDYIKGCNSPRKVTWQ